MDKNSIKKYAVWARNELIARVSQKAQQYGITAAGYEDKNADSVNGVLLSATEKKQRQALIAKIDAEGFEQVMEEVAYTWFNRFTALRFMEVNNYLPSHTRVFTNETNEFKPQILADAISLELEGLDRDKVFELKNANKDEELYKYLLIVQCNCLNSILPKMFQQIEDFTELLIPDFLLRKGSVIDVMVSSIAENEWEEGVEIIGWLYQYYIAEPKDVLINARKKYKKEDIPFVTQLFTSDWIVKYMVQNSLGRLWITSHSGSVLSSSWEYYISRDEDKNINPKYLDVNPENLRCIDPCMGSGHIICYMFDLLVQIYEEYGFTQKEAVKSIVERNIYGLDIDERASQLAYFSIMMKARQYDRRFLNSGIQPNVLCINDANEISMHAIERLGEHTDIAKKIIKEFEHAKEIGSVLKISEKNEDIKGLIEFINKLAATKGNGDIVEYLEISELCERLLPVLFVADVLTSKYDIVVTNPPYMNSSYMPAKLKDYVQKNYSDFKSDLFAVFAKRCIEMCNEYGQLGFLMPYVWMFISSYEKMRHWVHENADITTLVQLEYNAFEAACVPVATLTLCKSNKHTYGEYVKLSDFPGSDIQGSKTIEAINNPDCGYRFSAIQDEYRKLPNEVIAYWATERVIQLFNEVPSISDYAEPRQGLATSDNKRFLRLWFEVAKDRESFTTESREAASESGVKWFALTKGGEFRKWYGNNSYVVDWENDGAEMKAAVLKKYPYLNTSDFVVKNQQFYFRPGITWSTLTSSRVSFRDCTPGFIMETKGSICYPNDMKVKNYLLALLNSNVCDKFTEILSPTIDLHEGPLGKIPFILDEAVLPEIDEIVKRNIELCKADWDSHEYSWDFKKSPIAYRGLLEEACVQWESTCSQRRNELHNNEIRINEILKSVYLIDDVDCDIEDRFISISPANIEQIVKEFIQYAVGCMFGRYSIDCDGLIMAGGDIEYEKYSSYVIDNDNIIPICDDEYFEDDIVNRFIEFVKIVCGEEYLEENLRFIAKIIGGKGTPKEIIRQYFIGNFYEDHCNYYAVSGSGKRPIYWLFDSGKKNGFKCLIYMHRYQPDTIARIRTDYVHEQQSRYRTALADLEQRINSASTSERVKLNKQFKTIQDQAEELRKYEEKIHHLADQMISIDLDDGVKENYAKFQDVLAKIK